MRIPTTALHGHLQWTRSGITWAMWRLQGLPNGYATEEMKLLIVAQHQTLFQSLRGEHLLLGLCADVDPVSVVERMLTHVKLDECRGWADECERTLDALEEVPLGERAYWLAVPMNSAGWKQRLQSTIRAGISALRELLALRTLLPTEAEIGAAEAAALEIEKRIPAVFKPTRATAAEYMWIALHNQQRGLAIDREAPLPEPSGVHGFVASQVDAANHFDYSTWQLPSVLPNPWLDEGARTDHPGAAGLATAFKRPLVKVVSSHSQQETYQALQTLVAGPKEGWTVPGIEWVSKVEQFDLDVDFAIRFSVVSSQVAKKRNKRAENAINDQNLQLAAESSITGPGTDLLENAETLLAYVRSLNASDKEVEVQASIILAVAAETEELALRRAQWVAQEYKNDNFILEAPLGKQSELWWAMLPGVPLSPTVQATMQITTGREFASGLPLVASQLGDRTGYRFAVNITNGRNTPILQDRAANISGSLSGSFGVVGELGSGKSVLMKDDAGCTFDRGGFIVVFDRTVIREYATFAHTLAEDRTVIADLTHPEYSLDPLRMFGPVAGARMVQSLFAVMLGVPVMSPSGALLSQVLEPQYLTRHSITSMGQLQRHIGTLVEPPARELASLMSVISSKDIGAVLFDDRLPAINLTTAKALVFTTAGIDLPEREEVENEHLFRELSLEKRFGRAAYTLMTSIAREVCFRNRNQLAGAYFDEAHAITSSQQGAQELKLFHRDGRKHGAFAAVASHDPTDFGDEKARALIKTRYVMRQTDEGLAVAALEWLAKGLSENRAMVDIVTKELSPVDPITGKVPESRRGEGLIRDAIHPTIGKFKKTLPERPDRRESLLTTPDLVGSND